MPYCTVQQLEDRITSAMLGRLVPETGDTRARVLDAYIGAASARADAYLSTRYRVPLEAPSPLVTDICLNLALWQIEADRGTVSEKISAARQVPYDEALSLLSRLSSGEIKLGAGSGGQGAPGAAAGMVVQSPPALFAEDSPGMEGF